jgi:hypothetical protein
MNAIERLAGELLEEQDPRWKDEWERGYDAGRLTAGRELKAAIESTGP